MAITVNTGRVNNGWIQVGPVVGQGRDRTIATTSEGPSLAPGGVVATDIQGMSANLNPRYRAQYYWTTPSGLGLN